jgi:hypothetical protein
VYELLAPHGAHHAIEGIGAMTHGAVARGLGRLAGLLGDPTAAQQHFDQALASNRSAGLTLAVARTHRDAGVALDDRDELERALTQYRSMGISGRVAELERLVGPPPVARRHAASRTATWRREGESWVVGWGGDRAGVRDRKGMADLLLLIARPGEEIPALDLYAPAAAAEGLGGDSSLGEVLDDTARRQYRRRLAELESELDAADADGDLARSERAAAERDALVAQLSSAYGLGGRTRRQGGTAERARTAVTARIRDAVRAVEAAVPPLGRHLTNAVRTGAFCSYDPDEPVLWET